MAFATILFWWWQAVQLWLLLSKPKKKKRFNSVIGTDLATISLPDLMSKLMAKTINTALEIIYCEVMLSFSLLQKCLCDKDQPCTYIRYRFRAYDQCCPVTACHIKERKVISMWLKFGKWASHVYSVDYTDSQRMFQDWFICLEYALVPY